MGRWSSASATALRRTPEDLLVVTTFAGGLSFALWNALIDNFAVERAGFGGDAIGALQSIREIPGFLAFTVVWVLLLVKEQRLALASVALLAAGTAVSGFFPSFWGLVATTTVMSVGLHYHEALMQSLSLQWLPRERAPLVLGRLVAVRSAAIIGVLAVLWLAFAALGVGCAPVYLAGGGLAMVLVAVAWLGFAPFAEVVPQRKHLVLRRRCWLYHALTFLSGARRQIFVVFGGFLLVEEFGYSVADVTALLLANSVLNLWSAPRIAGLVGHWGNGAC
jgi:hypothetical protein